MNRKTGISAWIGVLVVAAARFAQEFPAVKPEAVGLSSERLGRIGTVIRRNRQRHIDDNVRGRRENTIAVVSSRLRSSLIRKNK